MGSLVGHRSLLSRALNHFGLGAPSDVRTQSKAAILLLTALLVLPSLVWDCRDRSVWQWDQSAYGEMSVELFYKLLHDPGQWPTTMLHAVVIKAPGIAWFGQWFVPLGQVLGSVDRGLRLSVLVCQFVTVALVMMIGRQLGGGLAVSLAGGLVVASAPLFVGMSHQFMVEVLQTMAVAWIYWIALRGRDWPRLTLLAHLSGAAAVAMLAKQSSPLYCLLPGAIGVVWLFVPRRRWTEASACRLVLQLGALAAATGLLAMMAAWYYLNLEHLYRHSVQAAVGDLAIHYGSKGPLAAKTWFWLSAASDGLFTPPLFLVTVGITLACAVAFWRGNGRASLWQWSTADWLAAAAFLQIVAVYAVLCFSVAEVTRYLLPGLPAVAVLTMWSLSRLSRPVLTQAFAGLAAVQWLAVYAVAFGLLDLRLDPWLIRIERDPTVAGDLDRVIDLTVAEPVPANRFHVVGVDLPWLNLNSLNYCAAKRELAAHRRGYFRNLGFGETRLERALANVAALRPAYFVSLEAARQPKPPDFLNTVSLAVLQAVERSPRFRRVPFDSDSGIVVYRQIEPKNTGETR